MAVNPVATNSDVRLSHLVVSLPVMSLGGGTGGGGLPKGWPCLGLEVERP